MKLLRHLFNILSFAPRYPGDRLPAERHDAGNDDARIAHDCGFRGAAVRASLLVPPHSAPKLGGVYGARLQGKVRELFGTEGRLLAARAACSSVTYGGLTFGYSIVFLYGIVVWCSFPS